MLYHSRIGLRSCHGSYKVTHNGSSKRQSGFTLLELMIVILIIGLILTVFLSADLFPRVDQSKVTITKAQISQIEKALDWYKYDNGDYPTTEQGLKALIAKPDADPVPKNWRVGGYLKKKKLPKDAWGNEFKYRSPGEKGAVDIYSAGKDQKSDEDDIGNW